MAIEWSNNLATGVAEIDDQHKELFSRFNNLLTACNKGKGKEEVLNLLLFLDEYIKSHFAAEERLQLQHNYPGYGSHKAQHTKFIKDVELLERQFRDEGASVPLVIQTNQSLVAWLVQHISKVDMEFAGFLNKAG
jgi:hemerythrin